MNLRDLLASKMVGLDVQQDAVRAIKVARSRRLIRIEQVAALAMPLNVFNGNFIEDWQQLQEVVSELVITAKLTYAPTTICLPSSLVQMGEVPSLARASSLDIQHAIMERLGGNELWQIDTKAKLDRTTKQPIVSYIAIQQTYLNQYIQCIQKSGLKVRHVDIDLFALKRLAMFHLSQNIPAENLAIVFTLPEQVVMQIWRQGELSEQQSWHAAEWQYDVGMLIDKIQQLLISTSEEINLVVFYLPADWMSRIESTVWKWPIQCYQPFNKMEATYIHKQQRQQSNFAIAAGLALYGV